MTIVPGADSREIRIFLSSTFRDMDAERNYLLQHVFPRFRQDCAQRNVGFTEIDLRWGITEQASQNGRTVEICLSEIDRCREYPPFFVGFLGERYGWIPAEADLDAYWGAHHEPQYAAEIRAALGRGISVTELEMRFGVLDHLDAPQAVNAHFFLRDAALSARLAEGAPRADFYDDGGGKLGALKQALRDSGKVALDGYVSVEQFGEAIYQRLVQGLDQRYPAAQVPGPLQQRAEEHARFAASRRLNYVPLPAMRAAVAQAIAAGAGTAPPRLYLGGPSGIGKSALMADLAAWLPQQFAGAATYARYSGADGSRELGQWRDDLLVQLAPHAVLTATEAERWNALASALQQQGEHHAQPVLLLLDAIDQLDHPERALQLLAQQSWPRNVWLLVSGLPQLAPAAGYRVLPVQAPDAALRVEIIGAFTGGYRKALAPALIERLSLAPAAASPLFLRMLLEELRVRSHHETLDADIDAMLRMEHADVLFAHLLQRWDAEYSDAGHPSIVSTLAALLTLSQAGLSEAELADLLAAPHDPLSPETRKPRLPAARLSPLLGVLRPYLLRNGERETLMHQALQRGALPPAPGAVRQVLIRHFAAWHWRHVPERLFQHLQLARPAARGSAEHAALEQLLLSLDMFTYLPREHRALMRDSLLLLGGGSAATDTAAARIGQTWAGQLRQISHLSWRQKLERWLRRKAGLEVPTMLLGWLNEMVGELIAWACYGVALPVAEQTVALIEQRGEDPQKLGAARNNLALLNMERGQLSLAACQFERLLALTATLQMPAHDQDVLMANMANLYIRLGQLERARGLAAQRVAQLRQAVPPAPAMLAAALANIGVIALMQGAYADALPPLEQARALGVQVLAAGEPGLVVIYSNLTMAYRLLDRLEQAAAVGEQAVAMCRASVTREHPSTAGCLATLGAVYLEQERLADAERLLVEALAIHRAVYGAQHMDIVHDLAYLGTLYQKLGRFAEADASLDQALSMFDQINSGDGLARASLLIRAAQGKAARQDDMQAERYLQEARLLLQASQQTGHPDYLLVIQELAALHGRAGDSGAVQQLQREALSLPVRAAPEQEAQQEADAADQSAAEQRLALIRANLPPLDPVLSPQLRGMAERYGAARRLADAEALRIEDVAIWRQALGQGVSEASAQLARALYFLGRHQRDAGADVRAMAPLEEALALQRSQGAAGDQQLLMLTLDTLARVYFNRQYKIGAATGMQHEAGAIATRMAAQRAA